ncbi:TetR/AcrR family transcriptional regulator [Kangiella sp. HZ709]|uniref:TetR/AcrR family transcriptional regulator n=1 Tax=Kangiella sp. HZ709 TaxID=2666328 RepID=UPI0012B11FA7|nr:TetR/AcrR family transcriptional regulator [Kangiella sp. HZ709]MRX27359.1 TetR family transcriptional regulator [Kangiella sp. HZ709]
MVATRAYTKVDKLERKQEILMSAEDLFIKQDGQFPTVSAICTYNSMAKGTVYLYFSNKDEIILALLEKYFNQWLDPKNVNDFDLNIEKVVDSLLGFITRNPYKFRLINTNNFLENNAGSEKVINFYQTVMESVEKLSKYISRNLDQPIEVCQQWLQDCYYYLQGLWKIANPSYQNKVALKTINEGVNFQSLVPEFETEAKRFMTRLWRQMAQS